MRVALASHRSILRATDSVAAHRLADNMPKTIQPIIHHYELDPHCHAHLVCPKCFKLHPFTSDDIERNRKSYLENQTLDRCQSTDPVCHTVLWRVRRIGNRIFVTPIRRQLFQDMKQWIGRLLASPGFENAIESHLSRTPPPEGVQEDFRDSPTFRSIPRPDGQPFMDRNTPSADLWLIFSLGCDSFNPFQNLIAHVSVSATAVYMALLVLPEHLRYKKEYMYLVTVMNGKPHTAGINHALNWLVDMILPFWEGIAYAKTFNYPMGRTVAAVVIPVVCDTEAAHQISGFPGHMHRFFCTQCLL